MTKKLSAKHVFVFMFAFVAVAAIGLGVCLYFFGNNPIEDMPNQVSVQKVDDDYFVTTDFKAEYDYQFKLEQYINGKYLLIKTVDSESNSICLSENEVLVVAGEKYRFSACYTKERGAVEGKYCDAFEWNPTTNIKTVSYDSVRFDAGAETLSWTALNFADDYLVRIVDMNGNASEKIASENMVSTNSFAEGKYKLYVVGRSDNENILSSSPGEGTVVEISRKNQILGMDFDNENILTVLCSHNVEKFEIYADGKRVATFVGEGAFESNGFVYNIDLTVVLNSFAEGSILKIKSSQIGYILESDLSTIIF